MIRRWLWAALAAICIWTLAGWTHPASAQQPARYIAIVYDDSSSMRYDGQKRDVNRNYIYANYALQNFVALMDASDEANIFLMSDQGKQPFAVERTEDLSTALRRATTDATNNVTYATAIDAALRSGSQWLTGHPDGQFMFVLMTDGDTMFDAKAVDITDHIDAVFQEYIRSSGIASGAAHSRALLFSISKGQPLPPVTRLQAALQQAGLPVSVFSADISEAAAAGDAIVAEMHKLADAMAQTSRLNISADGAFTAQYPLSSLLLMAQADGGGEVTAVTDGAGAALTLKKAYSVHAAIKNGPAATYYRVSAANGDIKPGAYRIAHTGELIAFPIVNLTASAVLRDAAGATVAQLNGGLWSPATVTLAPGAVLQGEVRLAGTDGQAYVAGPAVKLDAAGGSPCQVGQQSGGVFQLKTAGEGEGPLALTLSDPGSFQLTLPALQVHVQAAAQPSVSAQPSPSPTTAPTANLPRFMEDDLQAISAASVAFTYSSESDYRQIAAFVVRAQGDGSLDVSFGRPLPVGLQVRADGQPLDAASPVLALHKDQAVELSLWINGSFAEAAMALPMSLENGQQMQWNLQPSPRKFKLEGQPALLAFSVLDGAPAQPITWKMSVEQAGQWQEVPTASLKDFNVRAPMGLSADVDAQNQRLTLRSPVLALFSPVGHQVVTLSGVTGKPSETVVGEVGLDIADSLFKYALPAAVLLVLMVVIAYLVLLRRKPRLSMSLELWKSSQPNMQGAERMDLRRYRTRRALWPFGRETVHADHLELFAHPKDRHAVILNSVSVRHGLRIDGKGPQYHKDKDNQGDFILKEEHIFSLREPTTDQYAYYRIVHNGHKDK